jgi:hypothetical protein
MFLEGSHHILVHHNACRIASSVKLFREKHATTPYSKHVEMSCCCAGDESTVRLHALPPLQLLHRDHVAAARPNISAVDFQPHCEVATAILLQQLLALLRRGVVARNEMGYTEANGGREGEGGRGAAAAARGGNEDKDGCKVQTSSKMWSKPKSVGPPRNRFDVLKQYFWAAVARRQRGVRLHEAFLACGGSRAPVPLQLELRRDSDALGVAYEQPGSDRERSDGVAARGRSRHISASVLRGDGGVEEKDRG